MTLIETRTEGSRILEIRHDDDAVNPRDLDNLGIMACAHGKYELGDVQIESRNQLDGLLRDAAVSMPLFLYDHGGQRIDTRPNPDGWDTTEIGAIYTTKERIREHLGRRASEKTIRKALRSELETYNSYLGGEVYRYTLYDSSGGGQPEEIESCGGYYDLDEIYADTGSADWDAVEY